MTPDPVTLSAAAILGTTDPARVLGTDDTEAAFRKLARRWHPDHCTDPDAARVFAHLMFLRLAASGGAPAETVDIPGGRLLWQREAGRLRIRLDSKMAPDLGRTRAMQAREVNVDLKRRILPIDAPHVIDALDETVSMARVLKHFNGAVPPEHVAWMGSRLFELVAELDTFAGVVCGGIVPESLLVHTRDHAVYVLDWRFTTPRGAKLPGAPAPLLPLVPADRRAAPLLDVRATQRALLVLLGDPAGNGNVFLLRGAKPLPDKLLGWLRTPWTASAKDAYRSYRDMLTAAFGAPKYHKLEIP